MKFIDYLNSFRQKSAAKKTQSVRVVALKLCPGIKKLRADDVASSHTRTLCSVMDPSDCRNDCDHVIHAHSVPVQLLIPFVEDDGSKHEDRSAAQSRHAAEERREILEVNKVPCPVSSPRHFHGCFLDPLLAAVQ